MGWTIIDEPAASTPTAIAGGWAECTAFGWSGNTCSHLSLLLPNRLVQGNLLQHGHLATIAQQCGVQVDVGGMLPEGMRCVTLTGNPAANALAVLHVQWRCA